MSELAEFIEDSESTVVEPEVKTEAPEAAEVTPPEPAAVETADTGTDAPTASDEPAQSGTVPIAALMDERDKRQKYERELAEIRAANKPAPVPAPDVLDDQAGYTSHLMAEMATQRTNDRISISQEVMRLQHDDYDEVEKRFIEMATENPELGKQMAESGLPGLFAYQTVKKADKLAALENVDDMEARLRAEMTEKITAEVTAKLNGTAEVAESIGTSLTNKTAAGSNKVVTPDVADPLLTTFNR